MQFHLKKDDSKWDEDALWDHYSGLPNPSAYM